MGIKNGDGRRQDMKRKSVFAFILGMLLFGGGLFGAQTQILFDLSLYKAVPAGGARVFIRWTTSKAQSESQKATYFYTSAAVAQGQGENEIKRVFRVQDLERMAMTQAMIKYAPEMIRNGKSDDYFSAWWEGHYAVRGPLLEVTLSDGKKYDIRIIPLDVDNVPYRFKLQIHEPTFRTNEKGPDSSLRAVGGVTPSVFYVDVEFSLPMGDTTVIGFADSKDTPYFLSITLDAIEKTGAKIGIPAGAPTAEVGVPAEVKSGETKIGQPETVRTIAPEYPESCRSKGIEGSVGLEVSVDASGRPTDVKVVKSAHPDLDKAAVAAVEQWLFKPRVVEGKPKAAVYVITVDFKMKDTERR
jgi:TonB family protein